MAGAEAGDVDMSNALAPLSEIPALESVTDTDAMPPAASTAISTVASTNAVPITVAADAGGAAASRRSGRAARPVPRFSVPPAEPKRRAKRPKPTRTPAAAATASAVVGRPAAARAPRGVQPASSSSSLPSSSAAADDEHKGAGRGEEDKANDANEAEGAAVTVQMQPLHTITAGDYLSHTEFMKVVEAPHRDANGRNAFKVQVLRTTQETDVWTINTNQPFHAASATRFTTVKEVTKTKLAEVFCACTGDVFSVTFRPVLSEDSLSQQLQSHQSALSGASGTREFKRVAKDILKERDATTIVGRMLTANTVLGYSLVDMLTSNSSTSADKPVYRQVNHRDLLSLVYRDVKYVLRAGR